MKSLEEYVRIGIREDLRQQGKTYKEIEKIEDVIYEKVMPKVESW